MTDAPQYETDFYAWTKVQAAPLRALRAVSMGSGEGLGEGAGLPGVQPAVADAALAESGDASAIAVWYDEVINPRGRRGTDVVEATALAYRMKWAN